MKAVLVHDIGGVIIVMDEYGRYLTSDGVPLEWVSTARIFEGENAEEEAKAFAGRHGYTVMEV